MSRAWQPLRRPAAAVALCFAGGTWLGLSSEAAPLLLLFTPACLLLLGFLLVRCRRRVAAAVLLLAVAAAGWSAAAGWRSGRIRAGSPLPALAGQRVTLEGFVAGDPAAAHGPGDRVRHHFAFRVDRLRERADTPWQPCAARLKVVWSGGATAAPPLYGERLRMRGRVLPGRRAGPPRIRFYSGAGETRRLGAGAGSPLLAVCYRARRAAAAALARGIEDRPRTVGLLHALLLGYRSGLPGPERDLFAVTGTLHVFAISGLHVGVMAGLIIGLLQMAGLTRLYWIYFLAPLLAGYTAATGMRPSALRALVMAVVFWSAPALGRRSDGASALACAALVILAVSPGQLRDLGFIYSFTVVAGILAWYPLFEARVSRLRRADPPESGRPAWYRRLGRAALRYTTGVAGVSAAAWLASAPLTARCFGRFIPAALPGNLLVVPLALLIVVSGCLSLVLGECAAFFSVVFNHTNLLLVEILVRGLTLISRLPGGSFEIAPPPRWFLVAYYAVAAGATVALYARRGTPGGRAGTGKSSTEPDPNEKL